MFVTAMFLFRTGDKQEALMALRRELDEKSKAQNDELSDKMEKIRIELAAKIREYESIVEERKILSEKLNSRRDSEERQVCEEENKRVLELRALKERVLSSTENIKDLQQNLSESEESCRRLENLLKEKSEAASRLQAICATLECDVEQLRSELLRYVMLRFDHIIL
jgi:DNA-binding Xre family transcriptional regulator